jgi:hypothetical protein
MGQTIISPNGEDEEGSFGNRVDINEDGSIIVIGIPRFDSAALGNDVSRVQVYEYNGSEDSWIQLGNDLSGSEVDDEFGFDVAISDDGRTIACGAHFGAPGGRARAGYVQVYGFDTDLEDWVQLGSTLEGEVAGDKFGRSLALSSSGRRVAIGAVAGGGGGGRGRVYAYDYYSSDTDKRWDLKGQVLDGLEEDDWQGSSVDLSGDGNYLALGADGHDFSGSNAGMARVYQFVGGCSCWVQYGNTIYGESAEDQLGQGQISLSTDGQLLAVGANHNDDATGKAYLYRYSTSAGDWYLIGDVQGDLSGDKLGFAVNVAGDGSLFAVGAPNRKSGTPGYSVIYGLGSR